MSDEQSSRLHGMGSPRIAAAMLLAIFAAGALVAWWMASAADREIRDGLIQQTRMAAQALSVEHLQALTGTKADLQSPEYQRLKEQLAAIRSASPQCRSLYLMGRQSDGTVFFFVNSEPANSQDYTPPGQAYDEVPAGYRRVFDVKVEVIEGPVDTRRGTLVSGLVPIHDMATTHSGLVTLDEAQAMVRKAVDFYRVNGRERFIKECNDPRGEFRKKSLYVFAYDHGMTMQAHPVKPELVGQNLLDKKDWSGGKYFRKEIQEVALSRGSGWIDYHYENPATKKIQPKTTYVERVDDLIICAGAYKSTGDLLAVLGMDVDASDWKWDVAARMAPAVGLMLLMFIGMVAFMAGIRRVDASPKPILSSLMPPLAVMVGLLLLVTGKVLWHQHQNQLSETIANRVSSVSSNLRIALDQQAVGLSMAMQPIVTDTDVQKALRNGDADRLLAAWRPVFERLNRDNNLTHFYFFNDARVCLLRVHKPERRGDRIDRFTALESERTEKTASGIELGPLGTFTLRVVQPVFEGGSLAGYVELGKEIEDVLQAIDADSATQLAVVIRKEHLNRQAWEEGMQLLGREADWDRLPRSAVVYSSQGRLPEAFVLWADHFAEDNHVHGETDREIAFDGKAWRVSATPLREASGKEVGDLLVLCDISTEKAAFYRLIALGGTGGAVLLTLMIGFIYVLLQRTDTGIRLHQEILLESEARLRAITDSAQDAILMMNPEGLISYWNPAAERIFGYKETEAIGQNLHKFIVPQRYYDAHHGAFPAFQQTGHGAAVGRTLDLEARRKDGTEISVQLSLSAVHMSCGWHAVGILRDNTERKRAEAELQKINNDLEEATARANHMAAQAEMASAAKSEFLANMSHEIRTPMNGVIGMTGLLLDTELDDEQRRYAEIVRASGESLLGLINNILDFSKIEAKKLDLETLDFDLSSLLDDFAATLAVRAHEKGLELLCSADLDVPTLLRGDPGRLRQILTNLAGNAVKFTQAGEVAIRVSLAEEKEFRNTQVPEDDVYLRFSVRDTGIGIPEEKTGLLFNKFSQVDASTTRQYGGTGLGLAISRQLAELMEGEAGMSSEEGKGSEFWFTARLGRQAEGGDAQMIPPADLRSVRVLIVDDNATNREILTARLTAWGMRPLEVKDGPGALQALYRALDENDPFRIAVIDMQMPGMDGESLGRAIQGDVRLAGTRMVMLTSLGMRGEARRFQEIGFAAYATKPIRHPELKAVLSLTLTDRDGAEPTPRRITTRHTARETVKLFAGCNARILLAEDNITNQQVALGILKKLGLRADAVANGAEALRALETLPYDLVLMDVQMPEMDGYEAARRIRRSRSPILNPQIPIIAMTAHALQGDRERCLAAGMNDYVTKPVSPQALAEALDRWLSKDNDGLYLENVACRNSHADGGNTSSLIFDRAGMMARLMDDQELIRMVLEGFLEDIPRQIAALKGYLEAGDAPAAERQAHAIKGASANVGGERLREVAYAMEKAARAGDLSTALGHMAGLEARFEALHQAIAKEL